MLLKCHVGHVLSVTQGPGFSLIPPSLCSIALSRSESAVRKHKSCFISTPISVTLKSTCAHTGLRAAAELWLGESAGAQCTPCGARAIPPWVSEPFAHWQCC